MENLELIGKGEFTEKIFTEVEDTLHAMFEEYCKTGNTSYACVIEAAWGKIRPIKNKYTKKQNSAKKNDAMKFSVYNEDGSGMKFKSKEEFLNEISLMIDDCQANGGSYFDAEINSDASCYYEGD